MIIKFLCTLISSLTVSFFLKSLRIFELLASQSTLSVCNPPPFAMSLTNDISLLPLATINDHTLTSHIASRFHQGMPYVVISTGALVAVNTFTPFDINQEQNFKDLAARAYNRLCKRGENQVIIFLGESGSGKTDFRDCLSGHLLSKLIIFFVDFNILTGAMSSSCKQPSFC